MFILDAWLISSEDLGSGAHIDDYGYHFEYEAGLAGAMCGVCPKMFDGSQNTEEFYYRDLNLDDGSREKTYTWYEDYFSYSLHLDWVVETQSNLTTRVIAKLVALRYG